MLQKTAVNLPLQLDRTAPASLQDQLCEQLRQLIRTGRLKPNTRIIATRFLAEQVGVSRRTVLFAYEQLIAEGYLETRPAIGTFVSPSAPDYATPAVGEASGQRQSVARPSIPRSDSVTYPKTSPDFIDFTPSHLPSSELLSSRTWLRLIRDALTGDPNILTRPMPPGGLDSLRQVIADYLAATRGILASPDQVVIVTGRRQACALLARMFLKRHDPVVVECPGDTEIAGTFQGHGADVIRVPVDEFGLRTDLLPCGGASLAYVTPARQNPIGGVMPQPRRIALIEWARSANACLIEDDSDADLRYSGSAQPPLVALDPNGLTFLIGSFSARLGNGLCLGYLLAPAEFVEQVVALKSMDTDGGQLIEQVITANLLASGDYDHHLRRLRKTCLERRDALIQTLRSHFGDIHLIGAESGTRLTWVLPDGAPSAAQLRDAALALGIKIDVVEDAAVSSFHDRALIFGYSALETDAVRRGVGILAHAYERLSVSASGRYGRP